jgi:hypothetical protein
MPDDTAPLARSSTLQEALDRELYRPELLIAADDLDDLSLVVGAEQREGADDVEEIVPIQHAGHKALLVVGTAGAMLKIV